MTARGSPTDGRLGGDDSGREGRTRGSGVGRRQGRMTNARARERAERDGRRLRYCKRVCVCVRAPAAGLAYATPPPCLRSLVCVCVLCVSVCTTAVRPSALPSAGRRAANGVLRAERTTACARTDSKRNGFPHSTSSRDAVVIVSPAEQLRVVSSSSSAYTRFLRSGHPSSFFSVKRFFCFVFGLRVSFSFSGPRAEPRASAESPQDDRRPDRPSCTHLPFIERSWTRRL